MSYCIMNVVYGVPLSEEICEFINDLGEEPIEGCTCSSDPGMKCPHHNEDTRLVIGEPELCGFETVNSGNGLYPVGWCGVELDEFDECDSAIDLSELNLSPTKEQMQEAQAKVEQLHPKIRAICKPMGYTSFRVRVDVNVVSSVNE